MQTNWIFRQKVIKSRLEQKFRPGSVFNDLHPKIREMLLNRGILDPTDPQQDVIPHILAGEDVLILSPTGSGKTEAAILPIFHKIITERPVPVSALFITPLRALNRDLLDRLVGYGKELGLRVQVRHSDITDADRREIVKNPGDILITTPESLQILLNGKRLRGIISGVKYLVVDELHETAQNERGSQFAIAVERLRKLAGDFQRIGLSATVGNVEELASYLSPLKNPFISRSGLKKRMEISVGVPPKAPSSVAEVMGCDEDYAGAIMSIWELIQAHKGTLVFVNTRSTAEDIAFRLRLYLKDPPIQVHHGSLSREARETAEKDFKAGKIKALICTSSLELGIDIGSADLVLQFNSPRQINKLIQRVGRSGHSLEKISLGKIVCSDVIELEEASAIVSYIMEGHLEDISIRRNSLATLCNQVLSECKYFAELDATEFYQTVTSSYPFRNLTRDEYDDTLQFLARTGKIYLDGGKIRKRKGVLNYFIENISMIPSEKNYKVIDQVNRKFIGTLDERYVVNELEPGAYFVIRGSTWRIIRMDKDRILVEPFPTAAIAPKWSGEDIPVLRDVTEKVSQNRKGRIIPEFVDEPSRRLLEDWYSKDSATLDHTVIETKANEIIVQVLLGTKGNFALAEIFSGILAGITGESVETDYSPYHFYVRTSRVIKSQDVRRIILSIDPERLYQYVSGSVRRSRFFNSVFLYEARKFGIISNDADIGRIRFEKIVDAYVDTPVYRDSIRKLISDYMDLNGLEAYLRDVRSQKIEFHLSDNISDSSEVFLTHYSERVSPLKPTRSILDAVKKRLMNEEVILYCTSCGNVRTQRIRDIDRIRCPSCGSSLVASLSPFEKDMLDRFKSDDPEGIKTRKRLIKNAHLVRERGMQAIMVMAARGIGPETASRLLEVTYRNEDDLIRAILNGEMDYAKTRRFWD